MTQKRLMEILHSYVDNDYRASGDTEYIRNALEEVASHDEIVELGFGWVYPEEC